MNKVLLFLAAAGLLPALAPEKIVIAHRGASGYLPEHTLEAVALAHAMGADYIEQDVVLSKDGIPVVLHDIHVDAVTDVARRFPDRKRADGRYYALDFTLAELKQLRVTERFDHRTGKAKYPGRFPLWRGSFEIPTLEEELELIQGLNRSTGRNAGVYPEIKAPAWHRKEGRDISKIVVELLARHGYKAKADRIYLQCFDFEEVTRLRRELGYQGRLVQLIGDKGDADSGTDYDHLRTREGLEAVARVADGIGPALHHIVTAARGAPPSISRLVRDAHDLKLEVHPYTIRADALPDYAATLDDLLRLFVVQAGVDGVFTDHPDRVVSFLRSLEKGK